MSRLLEIPPEQLTPEQKTVFDQLVAEHCQCIGDRADLVAAFETHRLGIQAALREQLHARRDPDERRRQRPSEQ